MGRHSRIIYHILCGGIFYAIMGAFLGFVLGFGVMSAINKPSMLNLGVIIAVSIFIVAALFAWMRQVVFGIIRKGKGRYCLIVFYFLCAIMGAFLFLNVMHIL